MPEAPRSDRPSAKAAARPAADGKAVPGVAAAGKAAPGRPASGKAGPSKAGPSKAGPSKAAPSKVARTAPAAGPAPAAAPRARTGSVGAPATRTAPLAAARVAADVPRTPSGTSPSDTPLSDTPPSDTPPSDTPPPDTPPPVPAERHWGPLGPLVRLGARTLALTTLALALVVVLLGVLLLTSGSDDDGGAEAREDDRAAALTAARSFATALTSYDYRRLDEGFAAVQEQSTGTFKDEYGKTTAALRALLTKQKAVSKPTVLGSGVQSLGDGQAIVLLFVDQTITNASTQQPRVDRNRLVLTMTEVDGTWLASAVSLT